MSSDDGRLEPGPEDDLYERDDLIDEWGAPEDECEGAPDPEHDEPCSHRCGYVSQGRGLIEHELWEHRPCTECGAGKDDAQHLGIYGLTHKPACPRLQPGYVYPETAR